MSDLAIIEGTALNALTVFAPGGVEDVLTRLEQQARAEPTDISTVAGRKAIASLAYKVARSKTALDALGKGLTDEWRQRTDAVNAERRLIRERLDALADEVRQPLTDWENKDKARIAAHERALAAIPETPDYWTHPSSSAEIRQRLDYLLAYPERDWEEFSQRARAALTAEIASTEAYLAATLEREAAEAEAARLAAEEAERQRVEAARLQAERGARIAAEAAEQARLAAEQKAAQEAAEAAQAAENARLEAERAAAAERARIEREAREAAEHAARERLAVEQREAQALAVAREAEAKHAEAVAQAAAVAERVERERVAALAEAERQRTEAIEVERRRQVEEQARAARDAEKRAANVAHKTRINREILAALMRLNLIEDEAKAVITAIARGEVPHVKIEY